MFAGPAKIKGSGVFVLGPCFNPRAMSQQAAPKLECGANDVHVRPVLGAGLGATGSRAVPVYAICYRQTQPDTSS
jgi:hypothetical protein